MNPILLILINIFRLGETPAARLEKKEEKSNFTRFCDRIVPYVLFFALVLLGILIVVILVKYGASITGTEANHYYNGQWR